MYDKANGTLEGLSAPHGVVGDVAPQGLYDLGLSPAEDDEELSGQGRTRTIDLEGQ